MRILSESMQNSLNSTPLKLCYIYILTTKNGEEFRFTSSDSDILYMGDLYKKFTIADTSAIEQIQELKPDNFQVEGIINSDDLKEEDLLSGKFDEAKIEVSIINLDNLTDEKIILKKGFVGDITVRDSRFFLEIRCLTAKLQQNYGHVYSNSCRAKFAGKSCGLDENKYKYFAEVEAKLDNMRLKVKLENVPEQNFTDGYIELDGVSYEIFCLKDSILYLKSPLEVDVTPYQKLMINFGCNKSYDQCQKLFDNIINFRGEPFLE